MVSAQEKLDAIQNALRAGRTVYVCTHTRVTKITPKTAEKWRAAGHDLFRVGDDSLYMASGRRYDCADYCTIRIV